MGVMSSSSVSARLRLTQQSYHFCRHLILSRGQSEQLRRQSRRGRHEQGNIAVKKMVNPHPAREQIKRIPNTPSVVSPYSILQYICYFALSILQSL